MNNLISPYDSSKLQMNQGIEINNFIKIAKKQLKISLVQAQIEALGHKITLTTSHTRFNGNRLWFVCPSCTRKAGVLYRGKIDEVLICRRCINLL